PLWHDRMLTSLRSIGLRVYIGRYAMDAYLNSERRRFKNVTDAVESWDELLPSAIMLPHPSGRNNIWLKKNPWFEQRTLPALRARVRALIGG
ncbi:MAG: uracil-DNA glycosylase family protein, partial [Planctomycetota bacterium]